ncbi:MAG: hypothetical protein R6U52_04365, partial [Kosmotogaceae bacterium]
DIQDGCPVVVTIAHVISIDGDGWLASLDVWLPLLPEIYQRLELLQLRFIKGNPGVAIVPVAIAEKSLIVPQFEDLGLHHGQQPTFPLYMVTIDLADPFTSLIDGMLQIYHTHLKAILL